MKIGLLTLTPSENYGGILQAVALYAYLRGLGHDVVLINKKTFVPIWKALLIRTLEIIPFQNLMGKRDLYKKRTRLSGFIKDNLPNISRKIVSSTDLEELVEEYKFDAVVVGSDQVWRYQYIKSSDYASYFLNFKADFHVKKISYAASFGKDTWEAPCEVENVRKLLSQFDAISLRETSGVTLCKHLFGIEQAKQVLDPTLLVGKGFYENFNYTNPGLKPANNLVSYILDKSDEKSNILDIVKAKTDLGRDGDGAINLAKAYKGKHYTVEEWLYKIKNASFVVTDSFHGMLFSILFEKQFIVIGNTNRGISRFVDFLKLIELDDRLIMECNHKCIETILDASIDYSLVRERLKGLREISSCYIADSLS